MWLSSTAFLDDPLSNVRPTAPLASVLTSGPSSSLLASLTTSPQTAALNLRRQLPRSSWLTGVFTTGSGSVAYPHGNSRAEIGVKTIKRALAGNTPDNGELDCDSFQRAILTYRNTPDPMAHTHDDGIRLVQ